MWKKHCEQHPFVENKFSFPNPFWEAFEFTFTRDVRVEDTPMFKKCKEIYDTLISHLDTPIIRHQFELRWNCKANAITNGELGFYIVAIYLWLIEKLELTDWEIAAVLAHEIGHIFVKNLGKQSEYEADIFWHTLLLKSGFNTKDQISLLKKIVSIHDEKENTHPYPLERIKRLEEVFWKF